MIIAYTKYIILSLCLIFLISVNSIAQSDTLSSRNQSNRAIVYASDTIPVVNLPAVNIYDINKYSYLLKNWKYRRTIYNVKKAYPFAVIANARLKSLDSTLMTIHSEKESKVYSKEAEALIMNEFEEEVKKLTVKQGIILVKLIDRETGMTSYEVIKDIRGGFTAFFWQGIARIFGNNLKTQFDPLGDDKLIEDIVMAMQWGII